ncbi:hypothetical protein J3Q64DRAFT_1714730 [Phycomyces blakesleeanus]|uniref:Methyltransferase domain-containing protein n=2 Tax=Phycomyces blakesleeanus TaxID=4837 RepID=A0A162YBF3_PHYB8|nr:hypothetical protein PHYBLDRAFT_139549 [Phycomyces blakesleeanus NRRL 1555(-)]OAD79515.1 hypothetical protein PHYBLDRAFT_139549 [Phycomyces blakesleeanus NRRL 1555(-)]|eukprot:XP_018297555.1 hypothetical protein PHYBLDRAFT_139549 [Phycomyces blakesleeanus NRRL 1555(-)]
MLSSNEPNQKSRPWLLGWLSYFSHRTSPDTPQVFINPSCANEDCTKDFRSYSNPIQTSPILSTNSVASSPTSNEDYIRQHIFNSHNYNHNHSHSHSHNYGYSHGPNQNQNQSQPHQPRQSLTLSLTSERRNSQQTNASSVMSEDQFSSASCHQRDSKERSRLGELWSKARRKHPHYPRFHWPHRLRSSLASTTSLSHEDPHECLQQQQQQQQQMDQYQQQSPQFLQQQQQQSDSGRLYLLPSIQQYSKRQSIGSLISGDLPPVPSRPSSVFCSQPASPNFAALMKDGCLFDYEDDDIEPCSLEPPSIDRWTVKQELVQLALDGVFCSPIDAHTASLDRHVLQVGCGDASWAINVALEYPKSIVVAMDDREGGPPPNRRTVPRNFKFIRCYHTLLDGLRSMPDHAFDLVHVRFLLLSYTGAEYQALINECWRVCKPQGFVEIIEMDMRMYFGTIRVDTSASQRLNSEVIHVIESRSLDPRLARRLQDFFHDLKQLGQSTSAYTSLPLGVWGGRLGVMFREDVETLFNIFQPSVADLNDTTERSEQDMDHQFEKVNREMEQSRAFMNLHYAYAQKL